MSLKLYFVCLGQVILHESLTRKAQIAGISDQPQETVDGLGELYRAPYIWATGQDTSKIICWLS